ncbi:alpha/beta fold hydrolase [Galbitalea soli]|uniref:Alpha/beta hydrolase n=1 Tax=Galbitalea soli TaxID=1268042 RepID=A0A7C9PLB5_9MICO|nr:alpha/beta hydrolase [Galbitalea soli]NEM90134.1 alpha/beta hydrolase [Galbitalea soli]NYJ30842.1 pimeloyl-ACP methyl ester carboxylesterase [Galbitalea soli]
MVPPSPYAHQLAELPVQERTAAVLGSDTHYWVYGPDDAATTIVVVHGFRGEHHGLEPVVAQLRGIRVIAPDLPGFGHSTPMPGRRHDIEAYAAWLRAFVAATANEGAVILGHSFGSIVVAHAVAAGMTPPRVILVNPIAANALTGPKAVLTRLTVFYYWLSTKLPERIGRAFMGSRAIVRVMSEIMAETGDRQLRRWIHGQHHRYFSAFSDLHTVLAAFDASVSADVGQVAASLTMPTLLIAADKDPITSVPALRALHTAIPTSELHIIPGVGHLIHYEKPREAAAFIVDFLGVGRLGEAPA